uniref:Uncharacterized protein n=1 Tax=Magallana gigas TaxID=29159 RepID=K1PLY5_MAGGI
MYTFPAAAYGESCDNDHKKNVLEHYIYPDMYIVDLGRHYEVLQQEHHHHEHHKPPHHHHTSTMEHLVKEMDDLNDACVLDIVYFVEAHVCNGLEFVQSVAIGNTVLNPRAGLCTDGTHSQSEALVLNTCHADSPATWKSGYNVMQNCDRIPRYTPIATFLFGMYSMDGSSLSGMAVQVCGHGPLIFEVQTGLNHSGRENPYNYYTVEGMSQIIMAVVCSLE